MPRIAFGLLLLFVALLCAAPAFAEDKLNTPPEGFTALFNGKDLTGWKGLVGSPKSRAAMTPDQLKEAQAKADEQMRAHWAAKDGVLVFDGKGNSLCTVKDYADFELFVDWKLEKGGDSGIYLRGSPQVQIWDCDEPSYEKHGAQKGSGSLWNNQKNERFPLVRADKPVGEWNTFHIKMVGEKVTVTLNGKKVVDNVTMENLWERDKPIYPTGQIELQNHGNTLYFRNIYIKELSPPAATSAAAPATGKKPNMNVERLDGEFDKLVGLDAKIEVLGEGFDWSEGPCWIKDGSYLLFSDIPPNKIMKWKQGEGVTLFREKVGYTGAEKFTGSEPGTNGLATDAEGRIIACCHGDRAIKRIEKDGKLTVLADKYEGKRFNSPNDLVFAKNGDLYFTDPPYGLPKRENDPGKELDWFGVYRLGKDGKATLLTKEMTRPNGIGLSPDGKTLYVAQSDPAAAIIKAFPVKDDGALGASKLVIDMTPWVKEARRGLPDGLAVDQQGNLWATGPGGVYCIAADGKVLGRLNTGEATANCKFGEDGSVLYITADMYLCRIKTRVKGVGF